MKRTKFFWGECDRVGSGSGGGLADVDVAVLGEFVDQSAVGLDLQVVEVADGLRFEAGFGGIFVGDDGINFDAHDAGPGMDPAFDLDAFSREVHASPVKEDGDQLSGLDVWNPRPDGFAEGAIGQEDFKINEGMRRMQRVFGEHVGIKGAGYNCQPVRPR